MNDSRLSLPFGPLTRGDFETLSLSYLDASYMYDRQPQARERGVDRGDYLRVKLSELATSVEVATTAHVISSDVISSHE